MPVIVVDAGAPDRGADRFHDPVGARVAIVIRVAEQLAALAEQAVVAAPGVDADAVETADVALEALERALHVDPEPEDVPVERAVLADRLVREAAHLGEVEHAGAQAPGHRPPAFRTQIERQKVSIHREGP